MSKPSLTGFVETRYDYRAVLKRIGVKVTPDFINEEAEEYLIQKIEHCGIDDVRASRPKEYERTRVLRFGPDHSGNVHAPIPPWLEEPFLNKAPLPRWTRVGINYYAPGAGLPAHIDAEGYGPIVSVLSLGNPAILRLWRPRDNEDEHMAWVDVPMEPRSLVQLTGPSRYEWRHSVPIVKQTRYSIVFRN